MGEKNPRFEKFFDRDTRWKAEKIALRQIVLTFPLSEELKWRQPVYCFEGANVLTLDGFKDRCVLSFFKGVLLDDPASILVSPGPNSRSARFAAFTSLDDIEAQADTLKAYIAQAIEIERKRLKVDLPNDDFDLPTELADALDADPQFAEAWQALTPGRRRGWVLHFSGAKQAVTRAGRVAKAAEKIFDGKGMHDR